MGGWVSLESRTSDKNLYANSLLGEMITKNGSRKLGNFVTALTTWGPPPLAKVEEMIERVSRTAAHRTH